MPRSVSISTDPSTTIRPLSGRISPAIALTTEVLPAPERPNNAVRPRPVRKWMSSSNAASRCAISTSSTASFAGNASADAPRQEVCGEQRDQRQRDRNQGQPQGAGIAAWRLGEGVDRGCHGSRLARDVGHERDRRAELAEAPGKRQHHAGDDSRGDQWQGDQHEDKGPPCAERSRCLLKAAVDRVERKADRPHHQWEPHHRGGERRAGPPKGEDETKAFGKKPTEGTVATKQ